MDIDIDHLWAVTRVSMNLKPSNFGAGFPLSEATLEFMDFPFKQEEKQKTLTRPVHGEHIQKN